jgi:low temperature requirement protein LtrA
MMEAHRSKNSSSFCVASQRHLETRAGRSNTLNYRPFASSFFTPPRPFVLDDSDASEVWLELFLDLLFVCVCLKLGSSVKYCAAGLWLHDNWNSSYGNSFVVFAMFYMSWLHLTGYLNRFYTEDLGHKLIFAVFQLSIVGMTVNVNTAKTDGDCKIVHAFSNGFAGAFAVSRLVLIFLYVSERTSEASTWRSGVSTGGPPASRARR